MVRSFTVAAALLAGAASLVAAVPATADAGSSELVDHTEWVDYDGLPSLRVYPTAVGRAAALRLDSGGEAERAWREVLADAPEADTPGMREQFLCHFGYAEFARPGKTSWNLEPWRPVVDDVTMLESECNPGAAEEAF